MSVIESASIVECKHCEPVPNSENYNILKAYLPADYEYLVCNFNASNANFKARLRTNGKHQDHAHKWLEDFQMHSKCTMRVERTYPHSGTKNVFKIDLRCQHNTRPRNEKVREKESCKNTDCPAKMGITIKRVVTERKSRSKDPHLPDFPTVIQMNFCHNHDILTPEILKHRSVHSEVKQKILNLFKLGHNPASALDMHKYDLKLEYGEEFEKIIHDRALLPDFQYCYRLYYKIAKKEAAFSIGENTEKQLLSSSGAAKKSHSSPLSNCENSSLLKTSPDSERKNKKKRKLENLVMDQKELSKQISSEMYKFCKSGGIAGMLQVDENNSVMALCTSLMLRVHSYLKHSGEIVFLDRYGELDEPNSCHVYLLVTYSCIGVLPLGCIVTTSTAVSCVKAALDLWKQILPSSSFFNKTDGPDIFYVNDNEAEKQALKSSFPKSHVLLCVSHILLATWSFLLDRKNTIKKEHKPVLFSKIKMLLFSQSVEELEMNYTYAIADNIVKSCPQFLDYLHHIYYQRHEWSLVFSRHLFPRADDLSIFWQSAMAILKDPILSRSRTYNQLQVLDFMSRLDIYYERKLIDLVHDRFDSVRLSRFLLVDLPHEAYTITQFSEIEYEVHNEKEDTAYLVDVSLGVCECRIGKNGAPCKHQLLVFRNFSIPLYDCVPANTPSEKNLLFLLATGHSVISDESMTSDCRPKQAMVAIQESPEKSGMSNEIIHDLVSNCSTNAFFLDDSGITNSSVLNPSSSLVQAASVSAQDSIHSLLSDIDSSSLHSSIDQNLSVDPSASGFSEELPVLDSSVVEVITQICTQLKERTCKSPSTFKPALQTFLKNLEKLSSNCALEYALYSFGKFSKSAMPFFKRKINNNKLIGFQSTAGERKKSVKMFKTLENKV